MGRPNKPTELHRLHGTFRADRHGAQTHAVDDLSGTPEMPRGLSPAAKKLWKHVVPQLRASKVAKEIDATQLATMCRWWAHYQQLMQRVEAAEPTDEEADLAQWRLEKRAKAAWSVFDSIARRFGLTPSDRAKLRSLNKPDKPKPLNPLEALGISPN